MATTTASVSSTSAWARELRATLSLAWPLILAQLTQIAIYSTDVLMLGRLGPEALAASALAVNLFFMFNFTGMGLATACAPLIAAALGQRTNSVRDVRRSFRSAVHAALLYIVPVWVLLWHTEAILHFLGQDPVLSEQAAAFMRILQWTLLANMLIFIFERFSPPLRSRARRWLSPSSAWSSTPCSTGR